MDAKKLAQRLSSLFVFTISITAFAGSIDYTEPSYSSTEIYASVLYLQPMSEDLNYAVFTSGNQPLQQSWDYQAIDPDYSPGYELGLNHTFNDGLHLAAINWLHLCTKDSSSKQAASRTDLQTVEFVAPEFDVGPAVFGIKRADADVKFDFDNVKLNFGRHLQSGEKLHAQLFGGVSVMRVNQTLTTVFSNYAGSPATPYSYALPADPNFFFKIESESKYLGAGPDLGLNVQYKVFRNVGVVGEMIGALTAGRSKVEDDYTANSTRLINLGFSPSRQKLSAPDSTQVVAGFDGKLGLFYQNKSTSRVPSFRVEGGYRVSGYYNPISQVTPTSLVQAGTVIVTPQFATGTMAVNSAKMKKYNYNFNGLYLTLGVTVA